MIEHSGYIIKPILPVKRMRCDDLLDHTMLDNAILSNWMEDDEIPLKKPNLDDGESV